MTLQLRRALREDIDWINRRYDEVDFVHSRFDNEVIAVAECEGSKAGLGRLVTLSGNCLELGGIYVFNEFRGKGIARSIIDFLLSHRDGQTVYCIPFAHLTPFYEQFGFSPCQHIPQALWDKLTWCQERYEHPTALLRLNV